jgi:hypothetical protein
MAGTESIIWPVSVVNRDGGTVTLFSSLSDMQGAVERVDIENGEYVEVLDALGRSLRLVPTGNYSIAIEIESPEPSEFALHQVLCNHMRIVASVHPERYRDEYEKKSIAKLIEDVAGSQ